MLREECSHKGLAARQRVTAREVGVLKVSKRVEREAGSREGVERGAERAVRPAGDPDETLRRRRVRTPSVVERRARVDRDRNSVLAPRLSRTTITNAASGSSKFVR